MELNTNFFVNDARFARNHFWVDSKLVGTPGRRKRLLKSNPISLFLTKKIVSNSPNELTVCGILSYWFWIRNKCLDLQTLYYPGIINDKVSHSWLIYKHREQECILQEYSLSDTMPESNFERNNSQSFRSLLKSRLH